MTEAVELATICALCNDSSLDFNEVTSPLLKRPLLPPRRLASQASPTGRKEGVWGRGPTVPSLSWVQGEEKQFAPLPVLGGRWEQGTRPRGTCLFLLCPLQAKGVYEGGRGHRTALTTLVEDECIQH